MVDRANLRFGRANEDWAVDSFRMRKHPSKVFLFFLLTTDAAGECNANAVCKLPNGEKENERSEVKKNSSSRGSAQIARHA